MPLRSCLSNLLAFTLAFATLFTTTVSGQQTKVLAPHKPVPPFVKDPSSGPKPATQRSMIGGFWTIDASFKSSVYLRNNIDTAPITVTPVLYLSNGTKYVLADVKLEPSGGRSCQRQRRPS
jgi:hypothetical protein